MVAVLLLFVMAVLGTAALRRYAMWRQLFDLPGERRSHSVATPRGGGMAIVAAVLLGCLLIALLRPAAAMPMLGFAAGLIVVAGIGWWDDHKPLPSWLRLLVHLLASAWLGLQAFVYGGSLMDALLIALASVVLINVWNFMDGINGLAASQAALAAAGFALVLPGSYALLGWGLVAACLGFLPFNFPRARIFMGDGGSGALGYLLASLFGMVLISTPTPWWLGWLPLTAFLVDAGFTLLRRLLAGERWWQPHATHVYQHAARKLGSHVPVTCAYACFSAVAIGLLLICSQLPHLPALVITISWAGASVLLWLYLRMGVRNH